MTTKQDVEQAEAKLVSLYHATNKHRADISLKQDFIKAWSHYNAVRIENEILGDGQYIPSLLIPLHRKVLDKMRLYSKKYC